MFIEGSDNIIIKIMFSINWYFISILIPIFCLLPTFKH